MLRTMYPCTMTLAVTFQDIGSDIQLDGQDGREGVSVCFFS